jgi:hypothetical protein
VAAWQLLLGVKTRRLTVTGRNWITALVLPIKSGNYNGKPDLAIARWWPKNLINNRFIRLKQQPLSQPQYLRTTKIQYHLLM